jgi:NitT/TauT family transport system substrate-binding protein
MPFTMTRRTTLLGGLALAGAGLSRPYVARAAAATRIRFLTSWFAQAEHGGFYQALATGLYEKAGLDVSIDMGGPQVNGLQLLTGGNADIVMSYDIQVLKGVENHLPLLTIASTFQSDLQGLMTHPDISGLGDLKGHRIFIASTSRSTFWPWLRQRFGYTDEQAAPYTFNLQPFLLDKTCAVQGYSTSEPFEARQMGAPVKFFLFAEDGYPPYGNPLVTTRAFAARNPDATRAFLRASMLGWRDYVANPAPGNALIKQANPKMDDARIGFAVERMKALNLLGSGDAATRGIGTMTEARWQATYDFLVQGKILAPTTDWKSAFTTQFIDGLNVVPV